VRKVDKRFARKEIVDERANKNMRGSMRVERSKKDLHGDGRNKGTHGESEAGREGGRERLAAVAPQKNWNNWE